MTDTDTTKSTTDRDGTKQRDTTMQKNAPEGADGTSLAGTVPSSPSHSETVSVTTEYAVRFLSGREARAVEQDDVLTLTDVYEHGGGES